MVPAERCRRGDVEVDGGECLETDSLQPCGKAPRSAKEVDVPPSIHCGDLERPLHLLRTCYTRMGFGAESAETSLPARASAAVADGSEHR